MLFGPSSGAGTELTPVYIATITTSPVEELKFQMGTAMSIASIGTLTSAPIADDGGRCRFAAACGGLDF
ncbi:hypothetical protein HZS61_008125 [Fusarium oxysporum f. sp. conglutinans]|uniref:Uncharacterized protein n=1 Tax=Fusarium oxysporum f. sp. conglutinans TaxID=100902 RepID=A0A8H6LPW8_FUSOX|nr:hypothetical protein HZS61_011536 [Fusarium oxysporum f. sp. conglutinans]KAI8411044.1 hypothetical protein FOFC_07638 [Fusarium oxysporum]KAJ0135242.1 Oxidoreductase andH [Fusarium oxysporum f. sp. albedinis]KAF6527823.1 hypothetical protein HZS61_008125 [Fusarium oxysporum f. sp. conglutinans]KAI8417068.1 hypothetical protein FOFC_03381 [Fusarium oxysporum]